MRLLRSREVLAASRRIEGPVHSAHPEEARRAVSRSSRGGAVFSRRLEGRTVCHFSRLSARPERVEGSTTE